MITKDNSLQYTNFFADLNAMMREAQSDWDDIIDINDYFMELENIKNCIIDKDGNVIEGKDPYFLILPQDEELFEIDANTRKITVPASFQKNGIGVQNDESAEIIYFSIDRYFDVTDLYDKEIFVQWTDSKNNKGLSVTINKTLAMVPGKIVFGWPITSEITQNPGNVQIVVRFYERGKGSNEQTILTYSFSTLAATVKVNSAFNDFDLTDDEFIAQAVNKNAMIYANMKNSSDVFYVDVLAVEPTFDIASFSPEIGAEYHYSDDLQFVGRAMYKADDAEASKGILSYQWLYKAEGKETGIILDTPAYIKIDYVAGATRDKNDIIYVLNSESGKYVVYQDEKLPTDGTELFKLFATLNIKDIPADKPIAGDYYLKAINRAGRGNEATKETEKCWTIPYAVSPEFSYDAGLKAIIPEDGSVDIEIGVSAADEGDINAEWQYIEAEGAEVPTGVTVHELGSDMPLAAAGEGFYWLKATNTKNRDTSAEVESQKIRVTRMVQAPAIVGYTVDGTNVTMTEAGYDVKVASDGTPRVLSIILDSSIPADEITYQWVQIVDDANVEIVGATGKELPVVYENRGFVYKVIITNKRNGEVASTESYAFEIKA